MIPLEGQRALGNHERGDRQLLSCLARHSGRLREPRARRGSRATQFGLGVSNFFGDILADLRLGVERQLGVYKKEILLGSKKQKIKTGSIHLNLSFFAISLLEPHISICKTKLLWMSQNVLGNKRDYVCVYMGKIIVRSRLLLFSM